MAKSSTAAYQARQMYTANLTPLVVAAREGASQAAAVARRELARARKPQPWWRSRWVALTATGLVAVGVAGGVAAVVATRRSRQLGEDLPEPAASPAGSLRSTVDAGRERVGDLTRSMLHRIRGNGDGDAGGQGNGARAASPLAAVPDDGTGSFHHTDHR